VLYLYYFQHPHQGKHQVLCLNRQNLMFHIKLTLRQVILLANKLCLCFQEECLLSEVLAKYHNYMKIF